MNALAAAVEYGIEVDIDRADLRTLHEIIEETDTEPTNGTSVFYSPGLPMEDIAWMSKVYENTEDEDIGQTLELFSEPYFSKPY